MVLLLPSLGLALDPPDPLNVLFVADGWYEQEDEIEMHLDDLGYGVTVKTDYQVSGSTDLSVYDLIVITEFAPNLSYAALDNIESSEVPVLIVEYWDFWYSYRLGLTSTEQCGYVGTDTIEAASEGYDSFTSRLGAEALVYQPYYTVYGIDEYDIEDGVRSVYYSSESFGEVAVLIDHERGIAATGVYDTTRYTNDAWKLFDLLIGAVTPQPPGYSSAQEVAQAYVDSGLYGFVEQVEADLARDPDSWEYAEVEREAWEITVEWELYELWEYVGYELAGLFGFDPTPPQWIEFYNHPERPHTTDQPPLGASQGGIPGSETEHWFLGQYWEETYPYSTIETPYQWADYHGGSDLGMGISVELYGRRLFYMGDTWGVDHDDDDSTPRLQKWSTNDCEVSSGVRCDDMIAISHDPFPEDGIDVSPIFEFDDTHQEARWKPLVIDGVHRDFSPQLHGSSVQYWTNPGQEPKFTVPTGAVATEIVTEVQMGNGASQWLTFPIVMVWYGTAINPVVLNDGYPIMRPASWVGCSYDGINFYACYRDQSGDVVPFSIDVSPHPAPSQFGYPSQNPGEPARFTSVAAVDVTASDLDGICPGDSSSPLCLLDDDTQPEFARGGLLLYGTGRPYRKSGIFLGFIKRTEIGAVDNGKPVVNYWTGSGWWSSSESYAGTLTHDPTDTTLPPCDRFRSPNHLDTDTTDTEGCWSFFQGWDPERVFGEISARLLRSDDPQVTSKVLLLNNSWSSNWVLYWWIPLDTPDRGDLHFANLNPNQTNTSGYGPYIIDAYSDDIYDGGGSVNIWHTVSVWGYGPYGVYTGEEDIPW
ncbi:MAG: hypothetical protein R6V85_16095 [Polyangia bacterium]